MNLHPDDDSRKRCGLGLELGCDCWSLLRLFLISHLKRVVSTSTEDQSKEMDKVRENQEDVTMIRSNGLCCGWLDLILATGARKSRSYRGPLTKSSLSQLVSYLPILSGICYPMPVIRAVVMVAVFVLVGRSLSISVDSSK